MSKHFGQTLQEIEHALGVASSGCFAAFDRMDCLMDEDSDANAKEALARHRDLTKTIESELELLLATVRRSRNGIEVLWAEVQNKKAHPSEA